MCVSVVFCCCWCRVALGCYPMSKDRRRNGETPKEKTDRRVDGGLTWKHVERLDAESRWMCKAMIPKETAYEKGMTSRRFSKPEPPSKVIYAIHRRVLPSVDHLQACRSPFWETWEGPTKHEQLENV
ncbi:unnamed protein product [Durusdinium trenchii]|uniref:Secreted protein n=1 Tax=Durusdinium trenchii TaxID=1381693 RepID=A0ABP0LVI1_9DINO